MDLVHAAVTRTEREELEDEIDKGPLPVPFQSLQEAEAFLSGSTDNYDCVRGVIGMTTAFKNEKRRIQVLREAGNQAYMPAKFVLSAIFNVAALDSAISEKSRLSKFVAVTRLLVDRTRYLMGDEFKDTDKKIMDRFQKHIRYKRTKEDDNTKEENGMPSKKAKKK